jgi:Icc-related predicted phosphoesterase
VLLGPTLTTYDTDAFRAPRYRGALEYAPVLVGDVTTGLDRLRTLREEMVRIGENLNRAYAALGTMPAGLGGNTVRVLHVSDIHLNPSVWPIMRSIIEQYDVDVVVDTGDIADHGTQAENQLLTPIGSLGVPYVYIRGNHDSASTATAIADIPDTYVLDNEIVDVAGLTIAGIGDPRFTPDRSTQTDDAAVVDSGQQLASTIEASPDRVDFALVHDPTAAPPLAGVVPLVLAGHAHERDERDLGDGTKLLVQGSTGGAGLRALETEDPTPLTLTVLYFDASTHDLTARDEFTLGGLGAASAEVDRVVEEPSPAAQVERRAP